MRDMVDDEQACLANAVLSMERRWHRVVSVCCSDWSSLDGSAVDFVANEASFAVLAQMEGMRQTLFIVSTHPRTTCSVPAPCSSKCFLATGLLQCCIQTGHNSHDIVFTSGRLSVLAFSTQGFDSPTRGHLLSMAHCNVPPC